MLCGLCAALATSDGGSHSAGSSGSAPPRRAQSPPPGVAGLQAHSVFSSLQLCGEEKQEQEQKK